jgi:hypothetical protein
MRYHDFVIRKRGRETGKGRTSFTKEVDANLGSARSPLVDGTKDVVEIGHQRSFARRRNRARDQFTAARVLDSLKRLL